MSDFVIANMEEKHIKAVAKIERICFSEPWSEDSLKDEFNNKDSYFTVALNGDTVLGYMGFLNILGEGYITNIAVLPEYRGNRIGYALLKNSLDTAKNMNMDFLTLEVRESNITALNLYEKSGFLKVGLRKNFYSKPSENAVLMTVNFK